MKKDYTKGNKNQKEVALAEPWTQVSKMFILGLFLSVLGMNQSYATDYYINDNTIGETGALCTAVGSDANSGLTPALPKATIAGIRSVLVPGDIVHIDLGTYNWGTASYIGTVAGGNGAAGNTVKFIGVDTVGTNVTGGTANAAFLIDAATALPSYWDFSKIKFVGGTNQNALQLTSNSPVSNVTFTECVFQATNKCAIETPNGPGATGSPLSRVTFTNCRIQASVGVINFFSAGGPGGVTNTSFVGCTITGTGTATVPIINMAQGNVNDNKFDKCTVTNKGTGNIFLFYGSNYSNLIISNCKIRGNGSGIALQMNGNNGNFNNAKIYNNFISNVTNGVNLAAVQLGGHSIQFNSFYTSGTCLKIDGTNSSGTFVRNNIFYTTGTGYCVELLNNASPTTMDYNLYYSPLGKTAKRGTTDYATLADWKNVFTSNGVATSNDAHSVTGDPLYAGVSTGDLNITCASPAFHTGITVATITTDINNETRATSPSIGASEGSGSAGSITITPSSANVCAGTPVTLTASGASNLSWSPATKLDVTTGETVVATPTEDITYTVTGDNGGCPSSSTILITVKSSPVITFTPEKPLICGTGSVTITASGADSYTWTPATGLNTTTGDVVIATIGATQPYTVTGTGSNGCPTTKDVTVTVGSKPTVSISADDTELCVGESTDITASGAVSYSWSPSLYLNQATEATVTSTPTEVMVYDVIGTDENGCTNVATIDIIVHELPEVTANASDILICEGGTVTLTGSGAETYTWNNGVTDGAPYTLASTNTFTVTGTDENGCADTDEITVSTEVCTGVKKAANNISLEVYPNPNNGKFTLQFDSKKSQMIEVIVYDSKGQIQYRGFENSTIGQVSKSLDLNLTKGIYQIQLISDDVNSTQKIVVN
jgi:hypothetical protein